MRNRPPTRGDSAAGGQRPRHDANRPLKARHVRTWRAVRGLVRRGGDTPPRADKMSELAETTGMGLAKLVGDMEVTCLSPSTSAEDESRSFILAAERVGYVHDLYQTSVVYSRGPRVKQHHICAGRPSGARIADAVVSAIPY